MAGSKQAVICHMQKQHQRSRGQLSATKCTPACAICSFGLYGRLWWGPMLTFLQKFQGSSACPAWGPKCMSRCYSVI